jgi:hypothetical protein
MRRDGIHGMEVKQMSEIEVTWLVWTDQAGVVYERHIMGDGDLRVQLAQGHLSDEEWAWQCHGHLRSIARNALKDELFK